MLYRELLYAALGTGFTCLATVLGAAMVFFFKKDLSHTTQKVFLGFAAGVMIAASVWSLLIPAMEMAEGAGKGILLPVGGGFVLGGAALMLLSVFLWSSASIIIRRVSGRYDPMQIAMLAMLAALPFTGAWAIAELRTASCALTAQSLLAVLYMGLMGTAAAHTLWNTSLSLMDASFCSMFYPMQPLVSSILGVLILGERITTNFVAGGLIICCGIVLAVLSGKKQA